MAFRTSVSRAVSITSMAALALTLVLGTATSASAEESAILVPGGTAFKQINPFYPLLAATYPDIGTNFHTDTDAQLVDYSQNILNSYAAVADGVAATAEAVNATEGPVVVIGESLGSVVASQLAERLAEGPDSPSPDQIRFVLMATPEVGVGRFFPEGTYIPFLNAIVSRVPETVYDTIVVVGEYDGWADPPDRPWNLIASANALLGTNTVHGPPMFVADPATVPPENITVATNAAGGTVTTYLVPTRHLPLTQPLRGIGVPDSLVDRVDEVLRPIIDSAYLRHDEPGDRRPYLSNGKIHFSNGKIHATGQGRQGSLDVRDEQVDLEIRSEVAVVEDQQSDFDGQDRQAGLDVRGEQVDLGMESQAAVVEDQQGDFDGHGRDAHRNVHSQQEPRQSGHDEELGEESQDRGAEHGQESLTEPHDGGDERQDGGTERQNRQSDQRRAQSTEPRPEGAEQRPDRQGEHQPKRATEDAAA
ncbi:MAG: alpha/beta fold hydrolase [Actinomycetia bacterium]|nr:alpha/beta fold hydrolase [Actinomycetes bacterium]